VREAVIVSTARTPIGRAFRGSLNNIKSPTLMGHALRHAVQRSGVDGAQIEDVIAGNAGRNGHRPSHPYGMSGSRLVGHALIEGKAARREIRRGHHVRGRRHGRGGAFRSLLT
jgi:acetyl-CoA acetyltransferase